MPVTVVNDCDGEPFILSEFNGMHFPPMKNLDSHLTNLPSLKARDDDVTVVAYPKSGTHWVWEIAKLLMNGKAELTDKGKMETFIEVLTIDAINKLPSPRIINTHLMPAFLPVNLFQRKCKFIYIMRNPKDVYVSYFHHIKEVLPYKYNSNWNGFLSLVFDKKITYGTWFEYTNTWNAFFAQNPDIPVLKLLYEDLNKDIFSGVQKIADFLQVPCSTELRDSVVQQCSFQNMKTVRNANVGKIDELRGVFRGNNYPLFRKGQVGDWKTMFTVTQNERFDEMYREEMRGSPIPVDAYLGVL